VRLRRQPSLLLSVSATRQKPVYSAALPICFLRSFLPGVSTLRFELPYPRTATFFFFFSGKTACAFEINVLFFFYTVPPFPHSLYRPVFFFILKLRCNISLQPSKSFSSPPPQGLSLCVYLRVISCQPSSRFPRINPLIARQQPTVSFLLS